MEMIGNAGELIMIAAPQKMGKTPLGLSLFSLGFMHWGENIYWVSPKMKKQDERKEVIIMRALIAAFLIISVIIAFNKTASISTLMSYSWGALAGAFLGPFLYGLYSKKITKPAVWTSFIVGIGLTMAHMFLFGFGWFPELRKAAASFPA